MKNQMNKQKGFTLIELIIVIVILGILAVTAAPRFIDIQEDARVSTLQGVKAALQGASQLVFAKSAIAGTQGLAASSVTINGATVQTVFGYPAARNAVVEVPSYMDLDATDFPVTLSGTADDAATTSFTISLGSASSIANCNIGYTNATATAVPAITTANTGC
nr:prepilin-type N-terminal cleavage/methylation domain-containing protein [uncultured Glaciecola sp.]